jgi:hypothetical protein
VLELRNRRWLGLDRRGDADVGPEVAHETLGHRCQTSNGFMA